MTTYKGKLAFAGSSEDAIFRPETEAGQIVDLDDYLDTWYETKGGSGTGPENKAWGYLSQLIGANNTGWFYKKLPEGTTYQTVTNITDILPNDTSYVKSLLNTFKDMSALTCDLDLREWDVSNVTGLTDVFYNCTAPTINISGWDLSNLSSTYNTKRTLFENCKATNIAADNIVFTPGGTYADYILFSGRNVDDWHFSGNLKSISLKNSIISQPSIPGLFGWCSNLERIDLTGFDTSTFNDFRKMFSGCSKLEILTATFDFSSVVSTSGVTNMFNGCVSLGIHARTLKFKNVPSSVFADEAALRAAASIPSGCTVQIDNFI